LGDRERIPAQLEAAMHKRFILLLGMFLGTRVPMAAQTPAPQIVPTQERIAPIVTVVPTVQVPLHAAPFLLPDNPGKPAAHFSYVFARAYEGHPGLDDLKSLSPMHEVKTLILTQSLLPLVQIWGGRLRLDGLYQHASHAEHATWSLIRRSAEFSFPAAKLSRWAAFGRSLRLQPELSLWAGRTGRTPHPGMAVSAADCCHRSKLNCSASVSMSSSMFDEEESQEGIRQTALKERSNVCVSRQTG
jgi:hypothetical protein